MSNDIFVEVISYDTKLVTSKLELHYLNKRQFKITDIHFRRIYEDNRSLPNDADLKSKVKIFYMGVDCIFEDIDFMSNPKINFIFTFEVSRR